MARPSIVLIGHSGNAREIFEAVDCQFEVVAFLDDNAESIDASISDVPVLPIQDLASFMDAKVLFMIGSESSISKRRDLIARLELPPERFATFVHPNASVSRFATLGHGTVVFAGAVITAGAALGDHVIVLPNSVVHHDSVVGDYCLIGSNVTLAGGCKLGESCYVGSASSVRNGIEIGAGSVIGMAANVVRDVARGSVVVGNPARLVKTLGGLGPSD